MALFRRRDPARPDPDLPLSAFQVRRLHQLVAAAFEEAGLQVRRRGDHLVDDRGRGFGLRDLAAVCATEPVTHWPELVRRHVGAHTRPAPTLEQLTDHTLETGSVLRLVPAAALPPDWDPHAPRLTSDLVSVVAIHLEDEALTPSAEALARRDPDRPWRQQAAANLRALATHLPVHHERVEPHDEPVPGTRAGRGTGSGTGSGSGSGFDVVIGESGLTASLALALDVVMERFGLRDHGRGVLVGVPYRHQLTLRVIDGTGDCEAMRQMADYVSSTHALAPGPISPRVHWVRDGLWRPVTRAGQEPDCSLVDALDPEVAEALGI